MPKRYIDREIPYDNINFQDLKDVHYEPSTSIIKSDDFEKMKDSYYTLRGWDVATGTPTRETLEQDGLGDVAEDLEKRGKLPGKAAVK